MNSRLLFAAARGARIQLFDRFAEWVPAHTVFVEHGMEGHFPRRIHPDDEHLAYGPISSALRDAAAAGGKLDLTGQDGRAADACASYSAVWWYVEELHRSLFLLLLAESLCDEGL
jgi:hypothetical protein